MWLLRTEIRQEGMEFNHLWGHIMRSLKTSLALLGSGRNGWRTIIRCLFFATAKKKADVYWRKRDVEVKNNYYSVI